MPFSTYSVIVYDLNARLEYPFKLEFRFEAVQRASNNFSTIKGKKVLAALIMKQKC